MRVIHRNIMLVIHGPQLPQSLSVQQYTLNPGMDVFKDDTSKRLEYSRGKVFREFLQSHLNLIKVELSAEHTVFVQ